MPMQPAYDAGSFPIKTKRRLYILGLSLGATLGMLYILSIAQEKIDLALLASVLITVELLAFLLAFTLAPQQTAALEAPFHLTMVISLIIFGAAQIYIQYGAQSLYPDKLGFLLNSMVLWLMFFLLGSFLALSFRHVRQLLKVIWVGIGLLAVSSIVVMRPPEAWRYSYILSWVACIAEIFMASLMLLWLGQHQQRQATTDALTGVANRHQLTDLLVQHHARAVTRGRPFALLLIDIDHFKQINDRFGHAEGDRVLSAVASVIMRHIRSGDYVGRWGGDEFLALLLDAGDAEAAQIAERIRAALDRPIFADTPTATVSIGIRTYRAGQSIEDVLAGADQSLYAAKQAGRNQIG